MSDITGKALHDPNLRYDVPGFGLAVCFLGLRKGLLAAYLGGSTASYPSRTPGAPPK